MISPTTVKGKQIYRDACDESKGWNADVSDQLKRDWIKRSSQLKPVRIPRSVTRGVGRIQAVHLHVFADASNIACSAVTIAVVAGETGVVKGLLTSKSRVSKWNTSIARLELVSGQMAANMVRNLHKALKRWSVVSTTVWTDSMVALYFYWGESNNLRTVDVDRARRRKKMSGLENEHKLWPFTQKGGLSKFHAMPIFMVQAIKVRQIFGMWVKFLFHAIKNSRLLWKFHTVKKFIIAMKIFHAVKIFSHREKCASISCEKMSRLEKGHRLWRKSTHAKYRKHFTCLSHANFRDLVQACINVIPNPITSVESFMLYIVI